MNLFLIFNQADGKLCNIYNYYNNNGEKSYSSFLRSCLRNYYCYHLVMCAKSTAKSVVQQGRITENAPTNHIKQNTRETT